MSNSEFLRKVIFDGEAYITPISIHDMFVNTSEYESFYENTLRKDMALNDIKPYRLVFMKGREQVILYQNLLNYYDVELDSKVEQSTSFGYVLPWMSKPYFDWIYLLNRFTKTRTRTTNLYGFFRLIEYRYKDYKDKLHTSFFLRATENAYIDGIPVGSDFYCKLANPPKTTEDEMYHPQSTIVYSYPREGFLGRIFFNENDVINKLDNEGYRYQEIQADVYLKNMVEVDKNGNCIGEITKNNSYQENLSNRPDISPSQVELKLMGVLLVEMIYNQRKFISESQFIDYLSEFKLKDLGKRNIQKIVADAKKELTKEVPSIKISKREYHWLQDVLEPNNYPNLKK